MIQLSTGCETLECASSYKKILIHNVKKLYFRFSHEFHVNILMILCYNLFAFSYQFKKSFSG